MRVSTISPLLIPLALAAPNALSKRCEDQVPIIGCGCGGVASGGGGTVSIGSNLWGGIASAFGFGGSVAAGASASINVGGFLSGLFSGSASVSVTTQIDALFPVWGTHGFCENVATGLKQQASIDIEVSALVSALEGCAAGYVLTGASVDVKAAAAIFKCDEKDISYVRHEGPPATPAAPVKPSDSGAQAAAVQAAASASGQGSGQGSSHPQGGPQGQGRSHEAPKTHQVWYKHPKASMCDSCKPCDAHGN